MPNPSIQFEYSIAAVSKLTGVSCHALRVWERRYGFPVPERATSGHRRYSLEQVQALRAISERLRLGHTISELIAEFRGRCSLAEASEQTAAERPTEVFGGELVDLLVSADLSGAEAYYQNLARQLDVAGQIMKVLEPALIDMGERWFRRECAVAQERCTTEYLLRKLKALLDQVQRANVQPTRQAVVGTVQGDRHEGGALIVSVYLELAGWRAIGLGVDVPVREYQRAVEIWQPDAIALSFVLSRNINKRFQELEQIQSAPVFVGGRSILNYQSLARRHGLIPLPGPASAGVSRLLKSFADWERRGGVQGPRA